MKKTKVYLDMDGTIADLYGINNWLPRLQNEDSTIFLECRPLITEDTLLKIFPTSHYEIIILSMTPKNATKEYCNGVAAQKNQWLDKYFPSISKRIFKKYGNNKNLKNSINAILVDDNELIRNNFKGLALNPNEIF